MLALGCQQKPLPTYLQIYGPPHKSRILLLLLSYSNPLRLKSWLPISIKTQLSHRPPTVRVQSMPPTKHHTRESNSSKADQRFKPCIRKQLLWVLLTILVFAIVIPVSIMFGKKSKAAPPKSTILVPLYVYPAQGAWDPLFTAQATNIPLFLTYPELTVSSIESHPGLNFTVVVNPASGPGAGAGPDANYTREIPRLNAHANVRTVGYVSTDYTKRDIGAILNDITVYSGWSENATVKGLGMQGIFLDETPSQYDTASAEFFETIAASIRSATGLGKDPLVSLFFSIYFHRIFWDKSSTHLLALQQPPPLS